jgi:hypothetical protein
MDNIRFLLGAKYYRLFVTNPEQGKPTESDTLIEAPFVVTLVSLMLAAQGDPGRHGLTRRPGRAGTWARAVFFMPIVARRAYP